MASGIEEIIEEIEEYVDECKPSAFSPSKIIVNRDELESLLEELRTKTPEEIKRYQKIISNKEAILADAQNKADAIIAQAQIQTNELVNIKSCNRPMQKQMKSLCLQQKMHRICLIKPQKMPIVFAWAQLHIQMIC